MRTRRRPLVATALSTALLLTACAADAPADAPGATAEPETQTVEDDAAAPPETGSVTETTLQALLDMDPEIAAAGHDHGDDDHADHPREVDHPNGIAPERVVIPAIDVDADVIDLGLEDNGEMEVPEDFAQTGWFKHGPQPGRVGPAVIAGHVDSRSGPAVFFRLSELEAGDEIEVHGEDGEVVVFAVREMQIHAKDDFPTEEVYAGTPGPELRLITCSGEFDQDERSYRDNTIIFAERIDHLDT